jgi:hypothetical protein
MLDDFALYHDATEKHPVALAELERRLAAADRKHG